MPDDLQSWDKHWRETEAPNPPDPGQVAALGHPLLGDSDIEELRRTSDGYEARVRYWVNVQPAPVSATFTVPDDFEDRCADCGRVIQGSHGHCPASEPVTEDDDGA